jgi:hypothetical protein
MQNLTIQDRFVRPFVNRMTEEDFRIKFDWAGSLEKKKKSYLEKPLREWDYQDVLHFFKTSVTNDKKCIDTIRLREARIFFKAFVLS